MMRTSEHIIDVLRSRKAEFAKLGVRQLGLFGSYLRNEQHSDSDIDLLIDFEPEAERFDNLMAVCDMVEGLFQGTKIDVVTRNGLSPFIGPQILNEVHYV